MIIRPKISWFTLLFSYRGSVLPRIKWRLFFVFVLAALVTGANHFLGPLPFGLTVVPFSLIGLALSIFLGFRNNTSYDRFWEGRKLWGRMVNVSRSFARQVLTLIQTQDEPQKEAMRAHQQRLIYLQIGYVHALRMHLRNEMDLQKLITFVGANTVAKLEDSHNVPDALLREIGQGLTQAFNQGWLHAFHLPTLEASLTESMSVQGGCERIKSTPIPFSYTVLIHRIVTLYCLALPFGIVQQVGDMTALTVLLIAYAFYGLDAIGDEIEDPFGKDENDLPLATLSRMIEVNLRQALQETDLPPLSQPVDHILS